LGTTGTARTFDGINNKNKRINLFILIT